MSQYRIFFLEGGRFQGVDVIDCLDDEEAIAKAKAQQRLAGGQEMELWHRDRFITRIGFAGRRPNGKP